MSRKRSRKTVLHGVTDEETLQQSTLVDDQIVRRHRDGRGRVLDLVVAALEMPRQVR